MPELVPSLRAGTGKSANQQSQDRQDGLSGLHMDYCLLSSTGEVMNTVVVVLANENEYDWMFKSDQVSMRW